MKSPKENKIIHKSITNQVTGIILVTFLLTLGAYILLNGAFLNTFYINSRQGIMKRAYNIIDQEVTEGTFYENSSDDIVERFAANYGITILIASSDGDILKSTAADTNRFMNEFIGALLDKRRENKVLVDTQNYTILKQTDSHLKEDYIMFWGTLNDGNIIAMRAAVEGMKENSRVVYKLMAYLSLAFVFISVIVAFYIGQAVTRPVINLSKISKKMRNLDFSEKYEPDYLNYSEVDALGENMNVLSSTLEKTIEELKIDIAMLEDAENRRQEFISNISHELKTPIALIQGYAEGMLDGIADDEESRNAYLSVIVDESKKMNHLVKDLLTLSALEADQTLEMEEVDINSVLREMIDSRSILFESNEIIVSHPDFSDERLVMADEFLLEQVINNYLSNALHYVAEDADGVKRIDVKTEILGDKIKVSVFNSGSSISEEDASRIWDKFYKVDKARTREYGGSGIGLSIVKSIMELFKQEYGVVNHKNGVEFYFTLELAKVL